jgi:hypothetical protein
MATGDQNDISGRISALLPNGWFGDTTPVLDALLAGISSALASVYGLISYARLQTRIATATDGFLDLISYDFFGLGLPRKTSESDSAFRSRIQSELLLQRATRAGVSETLEILTGRAPIIFEPTRALDTGGLNTPSMGLNVAGRLGTYTMPCQCFIFAYRTLGQGVPNIAGLGIPTGALNTPSQAALINADMVTGAVQDSDIFAAADSAKVAGTALWMAISN